MGWTFGWVLAGCVLVGLVTLLLLMNWAVERHDRPWRDQVSQLEGELENHEQAAWNAMKADFPHFERAFYRDRGDNGRWLERADPSAQLIIERLRVSGSLFLTLMRPQGDFEPFRERVESFVQRLPRSWEDTCALPFDEMDQLLLDVQRLY